MTHEAKMMISKILLVAQERLVRVKGPFKVISRVIYDYWGQWGWGKYMSLSERR